nr:hypothetical protein CFP56_71096 [Quercus suber]
MDTLVWIPKSDALVYGNKELFALYACAGPATEISGPEGSEGRKTNHWVLVCALSPVSSIQLDPSPSGPDMSMVAILSAQDHTASINAVRSVKLPTLGLTINGLIDLIKTTGFDKYQFTTTGQGCRYWIYSLVKLLRDRDVLTSGHAVSQLNEDIDLVWGNKDELVIASEQSSVQKGTFYGDGL